MKKVLFVSFSIIILVSLIACNTSDLELSDFAQAYIDAGYEVDLEEKPLYGFIRAKDGFIFYIDGDKVAIYEYKSSNDLKKADFDFDAVNGRFGLESISEDAIRIFNGVGR